MFQYYSYPDYAVNKIFMKRILEFSIEMDIPCFSRTLKMYKMTQNYTTDAINVWHYRCNVIKMYTIKSLIFVLILF